MSAVSWWSASCTMEYTVSPESTRDRPNMCARRPVLVDDACGAVDLGDRDRRVLRDGKQPGVLRGQARLRRAPELLVEVGHLGARDLERALQQVPVVVALGVGRAHPVEERAPSLVVGRPARFEPEPVQLAEQHAVPGRAHAPCSARVVIVIVWLCRSQYALGVRRDLAVGVEAEELARRQHLERRLDLLLGLLAQHEPAPDAADRDREARAVVLGRCAHHRRAASRRR